MDKDLVVIIMAGGLGTRMESTIPKVIHKLGGIPMINYILQNIQQLGQTIPVKQILIVVGKHRSQIQEAIVSDQNITYVDQPEALGTGHAIQCCIPELVKYPNSKTMILSGDVPLFSTQSMFQLIHQVNKVRITVTNSYDPAGYGRIIMSNNNTFDKIVEHNDCTAEQLAIQLVNCGIYAMDTEILCKWLPSITNNNSKGEYYLTDIIEIIKREEQIEIDLYDLPSDKIMEVTGVNTLKQLNELSKLLSL
jgi:UDP-N-acetylglucosamine diphosphorylase/glucosamine-1-phosphate N-acetyltransferase